MLWEMNAPRGTASPRLRTMMLVGFAGSDRRFPDAMATPAPLLVRVTVPVRHGRDHDSLPFRLLTLVQRAQQCSIWRMKGLLAAAPVGCPEVVSSTTTVAVSSPSRLAEWPASTTLLTLVKLVSFPCGPDGK